MIHHVSISAHDPAHVADVLAELMGGRCYPFPGAIPDSFMAVSGDAHGTMIEVYPADVTLRAGAGDEQATAIRQQALPETTPFHFLLSVVASTAEIEQIGAREGWRTRLFGRGAPGQPPLFHVIELWIENRLMVELAPQDLIGAYVDLFQPAVLNRYFAPRVSA
jgi:hypothetical protein